jgi:hypothetical protein
MLPFSSVLSPKASSTAALSKALFLTIKKFPSMGFLNSSLALMAYSPVP